MTVRQLGYLVFECPPETMAAMEVVYRDVIGAKIDHDEDGRARVRIDGRPFRIMMEPAPKARLAAIGWETDPFIIDDLAAKVAAKGFTVTELPSDAAADRATNRVLRFTDGDEFVHEIYAERPFAEDADLKALFLCGEEENGIFGLGHIVQVVADRAKTQDFYIDVLGFGLSDRITWPEADLHFLHCNQRHHTIALSGEAMGLKSGMIHHLMVESKSREQVDRAYETLKAHGFPVLMTIGQHTNDEVYSFYLLAPAGFGIEFGYGGKVVEDPTTWQFAQYHSPSSWGHELQLEPTS